MYSFLTSLPSLSLYILIWILISIWLKRKNSRKFKLFVGVGLFLFLFCSTSYFPKKLIHSIEKENEPIHLAKLDRTIIYHIYVLGAGASSKSTLPASMNLYPSTLIRLVEGIRIYNYLKNSILITSAAGKRNAKSQAELAKETAIALGVKKENIEMLATPKSTLEEALAFKKRFGSNKNVVIVTRALHMPRAIEIFKDQGINVTPAPTDYIYIDDGYRYNGFTLPNLGSIQIMNIYHVTILKKWYYKLFRKS